MNIQSTAQAVSDLNGLAEDLITSVPGVLCIDPGASFSNDVSTADDGVSYFLKKLVFRKTAPDYIQCSEVFSSDTLAFQQGTPEYISLVAAAVRSRGRHIHADRHPRNADVGRSSPSWAPSTVHTEVWRHDDRQAASCGLTRNTRAENPAFLSRRSKAQTSWRSSLGNNRRQLAGHTYVRKSRIPALLRGRRLGTTGHKLLVDTASVQETSLRWL
jgi:hypothetical protein